LLFQVLHQNASAYKNVKIDLTKRADIVTQSNLY